MADLDVAAVSATSARPMGDTLKGVLLLAAAVFLFAAMNATTKSLSQLYAVPLIMASRYVVHTLLMVVLLVPRQGIAVFRTHRTGLVLVRAVCLAVASLLLGLALRHMPVAEAAAIIFLAPMVVVLLAGPLLGERAGWFAWVAVAMGFAGVLLIVRPGSGLEPFGLLCLAGCIAATVTYQMLSRTLARTETTLAMLFNTALVGAIVFSATVPFSLGGPPPTPWQLALFLSMGVTGGLGHFLFTAAYRLAPASLLAPVNYLELVWAGLLGWLLFGHLPDLLTIAGMAIITAAGVLVALRSARRKA